MYKMRAKLFVLILLQFIIYDSNGQEEVTKSPKKGLVIPYWPQHRLPSQPFLGFTTVTP